MSSDRVVLVENSNGIATITMNRPERRNAMNRAMVDQLRAAFEQAIDDVDVRIIVLTGAGQAFCAGADLHEQRDGVDLPDSPPPFVRILEAMMTSPTPIIARVNGSVAGGGNGLVAAADFAVAADHATFAFTEVLVGVAPAIISVVCLQRLRRADALELFLTGEKISAARASVIGLIHEAVPVDELDGAVTGLSDRLLRAGPSALGVAKRLVYDVPRMPLAQAFQWTARLSAELFNSPEAAEGMSAFAERRTPSWVGDS